MRLGVLGALPRSLKELTPEAIRRVREMGFTGTGLPGAENPADVTNEQAAEAGRKFADAGVDLVEYGRYGTNLVSPDAANRRENVAQLREAFRVSKAAGCPAVITGAGSLNPKGLWFPHPDNYSQETVDRLVATLKEAVKGAEDAGVLLGLECHTVTPLRDAETTKQILDAVGSPSLKVHLDPVNWMTWDTVYRSGEATQRMFDTLGPDRLVGAHNKGLEVEDKLIIHMNEAVTGTPGDIFDHAALLRAAATMPSDFYVVIEHLAPEQMPGARDHLLKIAEGIGVQFA